MEKNDCCLRTTSHKLLVVLILLSVFGVNSCSPTIQPSENTEVYYFPTPTRTPFQPLLKENVIISTSPATDENTESQAEETKEPQNESALATGQFISIWISPELPNGFQEHLTLSENLRQTDVKERSILQLEIGTENVLDYWVYALAAPFPTYENNVGYEDLLSTWWGESSGYLEGKKLLLSENTYTVFSRYWGEPEAENILVLSENEMLDKAWNNNDWAILPFENLQPRWKIIRVNEISPLEKYPDLEHYPLAVPLALKGEADYRDMVLSEIKSDPTKTLFSNNHDPDKMTIMAVTGVTALVRATASTMEEQGILYPAQDIGNWLSEADITHISNEVSFAENCPFPNAIQTGVQFCSSPRYIELLETIGTDVVELTGDHFADWGISAMLYTLDLYDELGWLYYGGGHNLEEGRQAVTLEHNGNKFAFIGCNAKGASFATASESSPGAVVCDLSYMEGEIERLTAEGYLVIATFQYFEYYTYYAQPKQIEDFQRMAEAGAVIISGSQAHHPQGMEFYSDSFIHYGLGNLFFDQYLLGTGPRQGFVDRHIFYDGKYINTELLPYYFVDFARPRLMTESEEQDLLYSVFSASGW